MYAIRSYYANAISVMTTIAKVEPPTLMKYIINRKETTAANRFSLCLCGMLSGLELMMPRSLPNATIEPVKVTAPMNTPKKISVSRITSYNVCYTKLLRQHIPLLVDSLIKACDDLFTLNHFDWFIDEYIQTIPIL